MAPCTVPPMQAEHIGVVQSPPASAEATSVIMARVRPPRGKVESSGTGMPGQGGRKQPGIGHQAAVVEGDLDPRGGCVIASENHYPRREHPLAASAAVNPTPSFGGFGLTLGSVREAV